MQKSRDLLKISEGVDFMVCKLYLNKAIKLRKLSTTSYLLAHVETPLDFAMCL